MTPTQAQTETPPSYANAGDGCDLGRYRTGEMPMVGDTVRHHGDSVRNRPASDEKSGAVTDSCGGCVYVDEVGPYFAARFDLVSRPAPSPSPSTVEPNASAPSATAGSGPGASDTAVGVDSPAAPPVAVDLSKPPLGLVPREIWRDGRIRDIQDAVRRYHMALKEVPLAWKEEYADLMMEVQWGYAVDRVNAKEAV